MTIDWQNLICSKMGICIVEYTVSFCIQHCSDLVSCSWRGYENNTREGIHLMLSTNFRCFFAKKSLVDLYRKIGIEIWEYAMLYCQNESHETIEVTYKRDCTCQYRNKYSFFCAKFQTRFFRWFFMIPIICRYGIFAKSVVLWKLVEMCIYIYVYKHAQKVEGIQAFVKVRGQGHMCAYTACPLWFFYRKL